MRGSEVCIRSVRQVYRVMHPFMGHNPTIGLGRCILVAQDRTIGIFIHLWGVYLSYRVIYPYSGCMGQSHKVMH